MLCTSSTPDQVFQYSLAIAMGVGVVVVVVGFSLMYIRSWFRD